MKSAISPNTSLQANNNASDNYTINVQGLLWALVNNNTNFLYDMTKTVV